VLIELLSLGLQGLCKMPCKGEVYVVATKKKVLTYGKALKHELVVLGRNLDQAEVAGAPSNVNYKDHVSGFNLFFPFFSLSVKPGIKGSLWFFQKHHVCQPCRGRGLYRQVPGNSIKGGRYGNVNILVLEHLTCLLAKAIVPCRFEMAQVCCSGYNRRNLLAVRSRVKGKYGRSSVNAAVTKPALGR